MLGWLRVASVGRPIFTRWLGFISTGTVVFELVSYKFGLGFVVRDLSADFDKRWVCRWMDSK